MPNWHRSPLMWHHAKRLSRVVRKADVLECLAGSGMGPYQAMLEGINRGPCWAAFVDGDAVPVGAWGWTHEGAVWSMWRDLTSNESRELLRHTPEMVAEMVSARDGVLENYVWENNTQALAWLRASKCFNIDLDRVIILGNHRFIHFATKPLEELPDV